MEKWKTRSIANNYKKLAHWNLPIESYERWLLRLFYLGWIVTENHSFFWFRGAILASEPQLCCQSGIRLPYLSLYIETRKTWKALILLKLYKPMEPEFDRNIYFIMYKWTSCLCFLHTIQSSILCFLIFDIFHFS